MSDLEAKLRAKAETLREEAVRCNFTSHVDQFLYIAAADRIAALERQLEEARQEVMGICLSSNIDDVIDRLMALNTRLSRALSDGAPDDA